MDAIRIPVWIDTTAAIAAGKTRSGLTWIEPTEAQLAELGPEQRAELARALDGLPGEPRREHCIGGASWYPAREYRDIPCAEAAWCIVVSALDARLAARAQFAAQTAAAAEAEARAKAEATERGTRWAAEASLEDLVYKSDYYPYGWFLIERHDGDPIDWSDPRLSQRRQQAAALIEQKTAADKADKAAKVAAEVAAEQAKAEAEQAIADAYRQAIEAWGTQSQRDRLARDLLPEQEGWALIRDHVFAPLAELPRYHALTASDVQHSDECYDADVAFNAEAAEDCSGAVYELLLVIERAAEAIDGADVTLRVHHGSCRGCSGHISRYGALVAVRWHGRRLSREYAIEPPWSA